MLLYQPNAVLGIRSRSHFFYQCRTPSDSWGQTISKVAFEKSKQLQTKNPKLDEKTPKVSLNLLLFLSTYHWMWANFEVSMSLRCCFSYQSILLSQFNSKEQTCSVLWESNSTTVVFRFKHIRFKEDFRFKQDFFLPKMKE